MLTHQQLPGWSLPPITLPQGFLQELVGPVHIPVTFCLAVPELPAGRQPRVLQGGTSGVGQGH